MDFSLSASDAYQRARRGVDNMYLRARSFVRPYLRERICFLHLEKCGGTSVRSAIERAQMHWKRWKRPEVRVGAHASIAAARRLGRPSYAFREHILYYQLARDDVPFVTGHVQLDKELIEAHRTKWRFVTLLREPVQRWISYYFFNRYKAPSTDFNRIDEPLEAFLDTPDGRFRGQDYVRLLTSDGDRLFQNGSGREGMPSDEQINDAKRTLDAFDVAGVLEDVPGFVDRFDERFGVRLKMGRKRTSPASRSQRERQLSPEVRQKIRKICRPNMAVYEHLRDTLAG
jgi:hypothetical protein